MKSRSGRIFAMAAGCVLAVGAITAITGFAGAGTASAASYTPLCIDYVGAGSCADSELGIGAPIATLAFGTKTLTNWTYPNSAGDTGAIRQADNVNYCVQVNASDPDANGGYVLRGASCTGDSAEQWVNIYNSYYGRTIFESLYDSNLCMSAVYTNGTIIDNGIIFEGFALTADPCGDNNSTTPWTMLWGTT